MEWSRGGLVNFHQGDDILMKVVSFIPYWAGYRSNLESGVPRNLIRVGGRYLINYSLEVLNAVPKIDEVFIYASGDEIAQAIEPDIEYQLFSRPPWLDAENVSIEDIVCQFVKDVDADVYVLLHPNSPFLTKETLNECVDNVASKAYDSAFTGYKVQKFAWYKGAPLNYKLEDGVPNVKAVEPVYFEQSSLYVFSKELFVSSNRRIGKEPFIRLVDHFEGFEVNSKADLDIAELIVNSGMYSKL